MPPLCSENPALINAYTQWVRKHEQFFFKSCRPNELSAKVLKPSRFPVFSPTMLYSTHINEPVYSPTPTTLVSQTDDSILEDLIHRKTRILASKLEVLAVVMQVRLDVFDCNLKTISEDRERVQGMLEQLDRQARYHFREHRDKGVLYQSLFRLSEERRSQAVECWRDIFMALKEFLLAKEAHDQSQARAIFIQNVGS